MFADCLVCFHEKIDICCDFVVCDFNILVIFIFLFIFHLSYDAGTFKILVWVVY